MSDPTRTSGLRRSFRAEGNRRLARLRSQTHAILVERDLMAARNDPLAQLMPNPGHRLSAFAEWFERTARGLLLTEEWWSRHLQRAYESGAVAGSALVHSSRPGRMPVPAVYRELAAREFAGIVGAMVQQASRAAGMAAVGQLKPARMYREVVTVLRKVGEVRLKAAVNYQTVQLHNAARLAAFRSAGITRIGVDPELLELARPSRFSPPPPPRTRAHDHQRDHLVLDATRREVAEQAVQAAERAVEEAQNLVANAEAKEASAEAAFEVATLKLQTEEAEVDNTEAEVAMWEARAEEVGNEDPDTPNHEARLAQAEVMVERADAKMARAEARRDDAKEVEQAAALEAERTKAEAETAREELATAETALQEAQDKLAAIDQTEGFVNVLTAGDDKVCAICQDLADNGPYSLAESEGMLPAHLNCRCAWIPIEEPADTSA